MSCVINYPNPLLLIIICCLFGSRLSAVARIIQNMSNIICNMLAIWKVTVFFLLCVWCLGLMNSRIMNSKYKKLSVGSSMTGEVVKHEARSSLQCSLRLDTFITLNWKHVN